MSTIITLNHVNQWYNKGKQSEVHALKDVSLEVEQGDYVAFFGPSGCGKTTMLYAISGIDRVTDGDILINDQNIAHLSNQELAIFRQTGIGIVFQQFNLVPSLTVLGNVALPMAFVGISKAKAEEEAWKLVKRLQLEQYAEHYPQELSGGQQQRVGIARALANNPPIIIADEPLGNLDSVNAKIALDILRELNEKDGRTIIMVTHEAWSLQDVRTIYHMKDGVILSVEHREPLPMNERTGKGLEDSAPKKAAEEGKKEASPENLSKMARILSNYFMRGHTVEETARFETLVTDRLSKKIDTKAFQETLDKSFKDGGVGLWKRKAERVASYIEKIVEKQKDLDATIELINQNPELTVEDEVKQLRKWITEEYVGTVSPYQNELLDEIINDRIHSFMTQDQFLTVLQRPVKQFGAGFPGHSAQIMAERLELILNGSQPYVPKQ